MRLPLDTLAIVGVGLIGGSIGLAARKRGVARRIVGVGRDFARLDAARRLGAIDEGTIDLAAAARHADVMVFCTPVDRIASEVLEASKVIRPGALLTDAGSTKAQIVAAIEEGSSGAVRFVGAHPLAGSEKKGAEHADAGLFVGRWTILTPTARTTDSAVAAVASFWEALGSHTMRMSPGEHDRALALTSHLPHLIASALAGILPDNWRDLTATGFRDTTRVAAGDPAMWTPIFTSNREAVLAALEQLEERLHLFRTALKSTEVGSVTELLTQGKRMRDALGS